MSYNTGNPVPSKDPRDLVDNAENLDRAVNGDEPTWTDRLGRERKSWKGMENDFSDFLSNSGYQLIGDYAPGIEITAYNQIVRDDDGEFWRLSGQIELPYVTTGAGLPEGGAFVAVGDAALRQELASPSGAAMVGYSATGSGATARLVAEKMGDIVHRNDYATDADFNAAKTGRTSIDGSGRLRSTTLIAGDEELTGVARRDAVVVGRTVKGLTDCHGFADRTVLTDVTDYGGYGVFDATVTVQGDHPHDHVFSFQDRTDYQGGGALETMGGFYSRPVHSGTGHVSWRSGVHVMDVVKTGGGTLDSNVGITVRDLSEGATNVAVLLQQSTGYTLHAENRGRMYHRGSVGFGVDASNNVSVRFRGNVDSDAVGFLDTVISAADVGVTGDNKLRFLTNSGVRLEIIDSANSYTVRPGSDNTQPLGDVTRRWTQLYAGTATISTSDEREKQDIAELDEAEKRVAARLKKLVRKYRFKDSVAEKGDSARIHVGVIAQDVVAAFEAEGLDAMRYAIVCYDAWSEEWDAESGITRAAGDRYGIRYEQLLAFIVAAM